MRAAGEGKEVEAEDERQQEDEEGKEESSAMNSFVDVLGLSPFDIDVAWVIFDSLTDGYAGHWCLASHEGHLEVDVLDVSCLLWSSHRLRRHRSHLAGCHSFRLRQVLSASSP